VLAPLNLALLFVTLTAVVWAGELYRRVKELTLQDDLTGALSRRGFIEVLGDESKRSRRYLHPLTVAYVDLDDFKLVNDVRGHQTGNSVLQVVARTMRSTLREMDVVARLGGDEFALLLSETNPENVLRVLSKLQAALLEAMNENDWGVTFSIGAVTFNDPLATAEEMIAKADELMYSVKLSGKNRIEHSVLDKPNQSDHFVRCSTCRTSFAATSQACPVCGGTALLDLQPAEHNTPTQRGVQAYVSNLEGELTEALRSLETILDILVSAEKSEHSKDDSILRLSKEDVQQIGAAVGMPEAFKDAYNAGAPHSRLLLFKQRVSEIRAFGASRRNGSPQLATKVSTIGAPSLQNGASKQF
jgi:diguanylate cyclase (GGDEF)-like protein